MTVHVFFEGTTEERVVGKVCREIAANKIRTGGKGGVNQRLVETLGPLVGQDPIRCLVLRDLDAHEGETEERIAQSLSDALRTMLNQRGVQTRPNLTPLADYTNVFVWASEQPDIRVALHIATYRWSPEFIKATIDDYILGLALDPAVAEKLAERQRMSIGPDQLIAKITQELPDLLGKNGIQLVEAKDYVRLYAAVIKAHTSPPVFAEKTLSHASDAEIKARFAPLFAALESLEER
jgi:hypothetical protein